ncbi:hypothetical protein [Neolewinella persica]|uniref:hypothetical protein n=1 Tax=Neolewinella persica TaxID=70998 RepID=UPI000367406F|nr:hypothetical protein [Neolewinella persica]
MKWQHFFLGWSIMLIIVGLIKSINYDSIVGAHGSGFRAGFELSSVLLFGLMGLGIYFVDRRRINGQGGRS